ncbi:MAG: hypothetical protein CSA72_00685 [Rhodobacterales bacterium]|nr:MAG: hypothetical protein CSA72_00685 [Rhodobacterales bacterium]
MVYLIGLVIVVGYVMLTHDPATRLCRWRRDRSRNAGGQEFWTCDYCGGSCLTDGVRPKGCVRRG